MNLRKLATLGLWDETSSGMNDLECYSSKYAQVWKTDITQQTNRARLYLVWEGAQTPCPEHLKGWPVLCCHLTGYMYIMNCFSTSLATIHYGSRSLCPYYALATKVLPAAGPTRHSTRGELRPEDCVSALNKLPLCTGSAFTPAPSSRPVVYQVHIRTLKCRHGASKHHNNPLMHNESVMQVHRGARPSRNTCEVA